MHIAAHDIIKLVSEQITQLTLLVITVLAVAVKLAVRFPANLPKKATVHVFWVVLYAKFAITMYPV